MSMVQGPETVWETSIKPHRNNQRDPHLHTKRYGYMMIAPVTVTALFLPMTHIAYTKIHYWTHRTSTGESIDPKYQSDSSDEMSLKTADEKQPEIHRHCSSQEHVKVTQFVNVDDCRSYE